MQIEPDTSDLKDELAVAIANVRCGAGAGRMAEELLKRDSENHALIGVDANGKAAYFHEPARWVVSAIPFDKTGCDGRDSVRVKNFQGLYRVESWVNDQGRETFAWVHPRFRWIFEIGMPEISEFSN